MTKSPIFTRWWSLVIQKSLSDLFNWFSGAALLNSQNRVSIGRMQCYTANYRAILSMSLLLSEPSGTSGLAGWKEAGNLLTTH